MTNEHSKPKRPTHTATDASDYVATDQTGLTAITTRTVVIQAPAPAASTGQGSPTITTTTTP